MDEEKKTQGAEPAKKKNYWAIILIVILGLGVLIGLYFGVAWILNRANNGGGTGTSTSKTTDSALVGNWDTGCLVPDPNSPWAERHTFTINSNGTANHKRYAGDNCGVIKEDHSDNITFTIPASGQINLTYTSGIAAGSTSYDIYKVTGDTLLFGHGFCNCSKDLASGKFGLTEATRFSELNNFLVYKKQ